MIGFLVAYITAVTTVLFLAGSLLFVVNARNVAVNVIGKAANIVANPAATGAHHLRSGASVILESLPETAFAKGVVVRVVHGVTFLVLLGADIALAAGRLAVAFGVDEQELPVDLSLLTATAWCASAGFYCSVSWALREEPVGHPWDRIGERYRRIIRRLSDSFILLTAISAIAFYLYGAFAVAGIYPLPLVLLFMGILGLVLTIAAGLSFVAALDCWTTLYGVCLVVAAIALIVVAALINIFLIVPVRNAASLVMHVVDVPALGVLAPMIAWIAKSRMGKAIGLPMPIAATDHPVVGFPEEHLEPETPVQVEALRLIAEAPDSASNRERAA